MFTDKPIDFDRFVRILLTAALLVGIYFLLDRLSNVLLPFFLAWLTAYFFSPIIRFYEKLVKKHGLAVGLTLLSVLVVSVGLGWLVTPVLIDEFETLNRLVSNKVSGIDAPNWLPADIWETVKGFIQGLDIASLVEQENVQDQAVSVAKSVWEASSKVFGVFGALFGVVTYLLYLIFIMLDYQNLSNGWDKFIPTKFRAFAHELVEDLEDGMNGYFKAQSKIVISVSILFAIGFKIIGLPFGIVLGVILGIMNYIPYLQLVGLVPAVALAGLHSLETGDSFWVILGLVLLVFVLVQLAQDAYLTPKFMGDFSGFNPAIILLSLSIWGSLLGMIGLIVAIPLTSLLVAYYRKYIIKGKSIKKEE